MNKKDSELTMGAWPSSEHFPALRKRPTQSRSRALVDAVEQACLRILDEIGEAALTVARIAEISGVAVGSIYQYFPTRTQSLPCCTSVFSTRSPRSY